MLCGLVGERVDQYYEIYYFCFPTGKGCVTSDFVTQLISSSLFNAAFPLQTKRFCLLHSPFPANLTPMSYTQRSNHDYV